MLSMFLLYRPGSFFALPGTALLAAAAGLGARFVYLIYIAGSGATHRTHLPSLILLAVCALSGLFLIALGIIGELIKSQRRISEENLYLMRKRIADEPLHPPQP